MLSNLLFSAINKLLENFVALIAFALNSPYEKAFTQRLPSQDHGSNPSELEQQLLAQLVDIQAPNAIGLWPFAPGIWALIIGIFACLLIYTLIRLQRKKNKYRKSALIQLERLRDDYAKQKQDESNNALQNYIQAVITLLKQLVFTAYPSQRSLVAGLPTNEFITFLVENAPDKNAFSLSDMQIPSDVLYGDASQTNYSPLMFTRFATAWIKGHKNKAPLRTLTPKKQNAASNDNTNAPTANESATMKESHVPS